MKLRQILYIFAANCLHGDAISKKGTTLLKERNTEHKIQILNLWENIPIDIIRKLEKEYNLGSKRRNRRIMAIRWYGGKYSHLDWLLPLLPKTFHFCEPFGGSAAVLLNREPSPVETYNDIDGDVVNFFAVLRDDPEELIDKLFKTPFSREEFKRAWEERGNIKLPKLERARLFFVRAEQVRIGLAQTSSPGRWAWCKLTSRRGMSGAISRWLNRIDTLWLVAQRLRQVQIENRPAFDVIKQLDSTQTLFYLDPPYPHETRGDSHAYGYELTEEEHKELSELLHSINGKAALSGYRSIITDKLYNDWTRIDVPTKIAHSVKKPRRESLWINYKSEEIGEEKIKQLKELGCKFHVRY